MNTHHILITLLALSITTHAAPPPELTLLRQHYDKVVAEKVTVPFEATLGALNSKFTTALDKAAADAQKAGNLPAVLAIEEDKKRIAGKLPLPDADDEQTPESLKKLRGIYREQFKKLEEQRAENHNTILPAYTAKLQELEVTLTKVARVDEAKEIMAYREGLALGMPATTPAPVATTGGKPPASEKTAAAKTKYPKGDDRKAAEWVLSVGGTVTLAVGGKEVVVSDAPSLPRGKFEVTEVTLTFPADKPPAAPITDLLPLAGLQELRVLRANHLTDGHLSVLRSLPALHRIEINYSDLTDAAFPHFATVPKLKTLLIGNNPGITGTGFAALAGLDTLEHLDLQSCSGLTEAGIGELAQLTQLHVLFLDLTPFKEAQLQVLDRMKKLRDLQVKGCAVTAEGIAARKSLAGLGQLAMTLPSGDVERQAAMLAKACPALNSLVIAGTSGEGTGLTAQDVAAFAAFPKLNRLFLYAPGITDATLAGVVKIKNLKTFQTGYVKFTDVGLAFLLPHKTVNTMYLGAAEITDAGLQSLAAMKNLKTLGVKGCPKLTADGIAAFKKARPDVKVEK